MKNKEKPCPFIGEKNQCDSVHSLEFGLEQKVKTCTITAIDSELYQTNCGVVYAEQETSLGTIYDYKGRD